MIFKRLRLSNSPIAPELPYRIKERTLYFFKVMMEEDLEPLIEQDGLALRQIS
jgi:hypothetical protein